MGALLSIFFRDEEDPPAPGHLFRHPVVIALDLVMLVLLLVFFGPVFLRMFIPAIPGF
jgi:hypothetical protein